MVCYRSVPWRWLMSKEMKVSTDALLEAGALWSLSPSCFLWRVSSLPTKHDLMLWSLPRGEREYPAASSHKTCRSRVSLAASGQRNPASLCVPGSHGLTLTLCGGKTQPNTSAPVLSSPRLWFPEEGNVHVGHTACSTGYPRTCHLQGCLALSAFGNTNSFVKPGTKVSWWIQNPVREIQAFMHAHSKITWTFFFFPWKPGLKQGSWSGNLSGERRQQWAACQGRVSRVGSMGCWSHAYTWEKAAPKPRRGPWCTRVDGLNASGVGAETCLRWAGEVPAVSGLGRGKTRSEA